MFKVQVGSMSEWLMEADCKSAGDAYAGSNPARPKKNEQNSKFYSCDFLKFTGIKFTISSIYEFSSVAAVFT